MLDIGCFVTDLYGELTSDGRTDVGLRPQCPVQVNGASSSSSGSQGGGRGSFDAIDSVTAALKILICQVRDGAVALDGAGHTVGHGAGVGVGVRLVKGVVGATDGGIVHVAVTGDERRRGEESCESLHFERVELVTLGVLCVKKVDGDLSKERLTRGEE